MYGTEKALGDLLPANTWWLKVIRWFLERRMKKHIKELELLIDLNVVFFHYFNFGHVSVCGCSGVKQMHPDFLHNSMCTECGHLAQSTAYMEERYVSQVVGLVERPPVEAPEEGA